MNAWENQQIRKGVTGAQLVNAQHDSVLSRFMIKSGDAVSITSSQTSPGTLAAASSLTGGAAMALELHKKTLSQMGFNSNIDLKKNKMLLMMNTGLLDLADANAASNQQQQSTTTLLEQAYAQCALEKPQKILNSMKTRTEKMKNTLRASNEIRETIVTQLNKVRELNDSHRQEIERINTELKSLKLEEDAAKEKAPEMAAKYRFYQEIKCYVNDLIDCLNEKVNIPIY